MRNLIKRGVVVDQDDWQLLRLQAAGAATDDAPAQAGVLPGSIRIPDGPVIVPLTVWQTQRTALLARPQIGVWLASDEHPQDLRDDVDKLALIAVEFPVFTDGRGYSIAFTLRAHYGYRGELRAFGDVLRDQLFYMQRVGFDAFAVRADRDAHDALKGLGDFSESYQQSWDKTPLFRRAYRRSQASA